MLNIVSEIVEMLKIIYFDLIIYNKTVKPISWSLICEMIMSVV